MSLSIRYLYHSGFAVETSHHFLVFDYWRNTPKSAGLDGGVIRPEELGEKDVIVFASHIHGDHYNKEILTWGELLPRCRLILSDDIPEVPGALMIGPNRTVQEPDLTIETFLSTDEGVAFLLTIDGVTIYHAGDLNWWHWEGESKEYNDTMACNYKREIDHMSGRTIDLAMIPVDPRLGEHYALGLDYLMGQAELRHIVPMHFAGEPSVVNRLLQNPITQSYRDRIIPLTKRGEIAVID